MTQKMDNFNNFANAISLQVTMW